MCELVDADTRYTRIGGGDVSMDEGVAVLGSNKHNLLDFVRGFLLWPGRDGDGVADQRYLILVGRMY